MLKRWLSASGVRRHAFTFLQQLILNITTSCAEVAVNNQVANSKQLHVVVLTIGCNFPGQSEMHNEIQDGQPHHITNFFQMSILVYRVLLFCWFSTMMSATLKVRFESLLCW